MWLLQAYGMDSFVYESAALVNSTDRNSLITHYAHCGYSAQEIFTFLREVHGIQVR